MDNLFIYLLQVSAGSVLLYICFILFYRNDTFYKRNRILLMLIMILPVVFPLLSVGKPGTVAAGSSTIVLVSRISDVGQEIESTFNAGIEKVNISNIIIVIWLTGFLVLLLRTAVSLATTFRIILKGERIGYGKIKLVVSDLPHPPFSFWPWAVIPREIFNSSENYYIIKHEECHIRQMHTIDLIFSELFLAVFWFNPAAWFIKKSVVLNHEYLADNKTVHNTSGAKEYQYRLVNLATGIRPLPLANNFSTNIKNRITMINKNPTNRIAVMKNLIFLPAILFLFLSFSFSNKALSQQEKKSTEVFSSESNKAIIELIFKNITYPQRARENGDTGRITVVLRAGKGGVIELVDSYSGLDSPSHKSKYSKIPLLDEIVIVAYGKNRPAEGVKYTATEKKLIFGEECQRVSLLISSLDLPEWENGPFKFGIPFVFDLKFPGKPASESDLAGKLKEIPDNAMFMLDGKEVSKRQYEAVNPNSISTVSILKDQSAIAVFGEKGKNGVIVITTKK